MVMVDKSIWSLQVCSVFFIQIPIFASGSQSKHITIQDNSFSCQIDTGDIVVQIVPRLAYKAV